MADDTTTYSTPNGPKTIAQITSEMHAAGYNGDYNDTAGLIAAYNSTASGSSSGASSATTSSAQGLLDAIASGNTQDFNEKVREFNANYALDQQRLALDQTTQYGNFAQGLLNTASNLRGPSDYYQYENYLHGGKDLVQSLYGSTPLPSFQAPYGTNTPVSLSGLMQSLGLLPATSTTTTPSPVSATAAATGAPPTTVPGPSGTPVVASAPAAAPAPSGTGVAMEPATPAPAPTPTSTTPVSGAATLAGYPTASSLPTPATVSPISQAATLAGYPDNFSLPNPAPYTAPAATSTTGAGGAPQTPLPYQINPAVWDSIGPVGQALTLSAYSANGGDPSEFMRQLNAARPQGTAPSGSSTQFTSSAGAF